MRLLDLFQSLLSLSLDKERCSAEPDQFKRVEKLDWWRGALLDSLNKTSKGNRAWGSSMVDSIFWNMESTTDCDNNQNSLGGQAEFCLLLVN